MRLVLLGAPGAGKGTQAGLLEQKYGCVHVSTGDILRRNLRDKTDLGLRVEAFMKKGELVPDEIVIDMVSNWIHENDVIRGFLMDGFPRTLPQAEAFDNVLKAADAPLDGALLLEIGEDVLVWRLTHRRTCRSCGKIWNLLTMKNFDGQTCPDCGGELYLRDDDTENVIRNRLKVYHEQTAPLVAWYKNRGVLREIDSSGTMEETFNKIQAVLGKT